MSYVKYYYYNFILTYLVFWMKKDLVILLCCQICTHTMINPTNSIWWLWSFSLWAFNVLSSFNTVIDTIICFGYCHDSLRWSQLYTIIMFICECVVCNINLVTLSRMYLIETWISDNLLSKPTFSSLSRNKYIFAQLCACVVHTMLFRISIYIRVKLKMYMSESNWPYLWKDINVFWTSSSIIRLSSRYLTNVSVLSNLFINIRYICDHLPWFRTSCNQAKVVWHVNIRECNCQCILYGQHTHTHT